MTIRKSTLNLTTGYIPKADATGLSNSPIYTDGTNVGIGTATLTNLLDISGSATSHGVTIIRNAVNTGDVNHGMLNLFNIATGAEGNDARIMFTFKPIGSSIGADPMASMGAVKEAGDNCAALQFNTRSASAYTEKMRITSGGYVGIGMTPGHLLDLVADDAGKPSTDTWTIVSDERLKDNIQLADLKRCYEIVKNLPLKRFTWKDNVYTPEQVKDRSKLGWISQDVKDVFPKGVSQGRFASKQQIEDGIEEYEEQDFIIEIIAEEVEAIEIRDSIPTLVKKVTDREVKTMLFDEVLLFDEAGNPVLDKDGVSRTYQMPRMVKKTRPLMKSAVEIEDCLDLNANQVYAAMYGAIQFLMAKVDKLENKLLVNK